MNFFDELRTKAEFLSSNPEKDNEATRHDLLIYPIVTSQFGLGWKPTDLISQSIIKIPSEISDSHIFRGATPKIRKPDLIICPEEVIKNIAVIEEKNKQKGLTELKNHRLQLSEYQSLYECNWGILTDGEKWVIKKGFETLFEFASIDEIQKNIIEFKNTLGRESMIKRFFNYNTFDLVIISQINSWVISNYPEYSDIPTVVVGVNGKTITNNGLGFEEYLSFREALKDFPDLHPKLNTKRFTWAMKETKGDKVIKLRFETWKANDIYST